MNRTGLDEVVVLLNRVLEMRLAGVLRYTRYSMMVSGYSKLALSTLFTDFASQSLWQAQEAGRLLTAMNERPLLPMSGDDMEPSQQSSREMLLRALNHERKLLELHRELLRTTQTLGSYLEELAASMLISAEAQSRELAHHLDGLEAPVYARQTA